MNNAAASLPAVSFFIGWPEMEGVEDTAWLGAVADELKQRGILAPAGDCAFERLTGGVSSDIWTIAQGDRRVAVKRALPKLRVEQDWQAPVSRNAADARWLQTVRGIMPEAVPEILHHDEAAHFFVMSYIEPERAPVWKSQLLSGTVSASFAAAVGRAIGRIHAATAGRADIWAAFDNGETFRAIRLSPYLESTALRHPPLAPRIREVIEITAARRECLIHGDMSPKNILAADTGPIFLDAECATCGDPAFDLAFCLNHLLLKRLRAADPAPLFDAFEAMASGYFETARFAGAEHVERRAAALLPMLFLARVDGKSPVEYITEESERDLIRRVAAPLITTPVETLREINERWQRALNEGKT